MLTVLRDTQGRLAVACEWWLVNQSGEQDWLTGRWVRVEQVEISTHYGRQMFPILIQKIAELAPQAIGAFWERRDKQDGRIHTYRREQLLREEVRV